MSKEAFLDHLSYESVQQVVEIDKEPEVVDLVEEENWEEGEVRREKQVFSQI